MLFHSPTRRSCRSSVRTWGRARKRPQVMIALLAPWVGYWSELWGRKGSSLPASQPKRLRGVLFTFVTIIAIDLRSIAQWNHGGDRDGADDPDHRRPDHRNGTLQPDAECAFAPSITAEPASPDEVSYRVAFVFSAFRLSACRVLGWLRSRVPGCSTYRRCSDCCAPTGRVQHRSGPARISPKSLPRRHVRHAR